MSSTNTPIWPQTTYLLWLSANRDKIQNMCGAKDFNTVTARAWELWMATTTRELQPFEAQAGRQKEAHAAFIAARYKRKTPEETTRWQMVKRSDGDMKCEKKTTPRETRCCLAATRSVHESQETGNHINTYVTRRRDTRRRIAPQLGELDGPQIAQKRKQ